MNFRIKSLLKIFGDEKKNNHTSPNPDNVGYQRIFQTFFSKKQPSERKKNGRLRDLISPFAKQSTHPRS